MKISATKTVSQRTAWLMLLTLLILAFAFVLLPAYLLNLFRAQTPQELKISFLLTEWAPLSTLIFTVMALILGYHLWLRTHQWWSKLVLVIAVLPILATPWFAHQKPLEFLFKPLQNPDYVSTHEVDFLSDNDMVMAIELNGEAVAYPVRQVGYHHIVHDHIGVFLLSSLTDRSVAPVRCWKQKLMAVN